MKKTSTFLMVVFAVIFLVCCGNSTQKNQEPENEIESSKYSDDLTGYYSLEEGGEPRYKIEYGGRKDYGKGEVYETTYNVTTYFRGEPIDVIYKNLDIYDKLKAWPTSLQGYEELLGLGFEKWVKHSVNAQNHTSSIIQTEKGYHYKRHIDEKKFGNMVVFEARDIDIISKTGYLLHDSEHNFHILYKVGDIEEDKEETEK